MELNEGDTTLYNDLANKIMAEKSFQLPAGNLSELEKVAFSSVIKSDENMIAVEPNMLLLKILLDRLIGLLNIPVRYGLKADFDFFLEICYYFRGDRSTVRRLQTQERKFLHYIISNTNTESSHELDKLLEQYKWLHLELLNAFIPLIHHLNSKQLFNISKAFWDHCPPNRDKTSMLFALLETIKEVTAEDSKLAEEYFKLLLDSTLYPKELIAAVIAGVLSASKFNSKIFDNLIIENRHHEAIAGGLLGANIFNEESAGRLYTISERIFDTNNEVKRLVILLYQRIADNEGIVDVKLKEKCLQRIEQVCASDDSELVSIGLRGLTNLSPRYSDFVFKIIDDLGHRYDERQIFSSCVDVFYRHRNCEEFFKLITKRALSVRTKFNGGDLVDVISLFYDEHRDSLCRGLINLLIDDRGLVRFAGTSLLGQILNTFDNSFRFSIDLTQLPSLDQYKVWVSLLDDDARVMDFLPITLPILNSQNWFVAESLMARIEEEIKNYGSTIYSILEKNLIDENPMKADALSRVKTTMDVEFAKNDDKLKIKELDPRYTQSTLLHKYYEIFKKRTSEELEEQVDKKSIFRQLATTINLAKGGGWLNKDTGKVMELKKVAYEKQLPAKYFSDPENIDAERISKILQSNWSEEFKECEAIISLYENTLNP